MYIQIRVFLDMKTAHLISYNAIQRAYALSVIETAKQTQEQFKALYYNAQIANTGSTITCPVCKTSFVKQLAYTCSIQCKMSLFEDIDIPYILRVRPTTETAAAFLLRLYQKIDAYIHSTKVATGSTFNCPNCTKLVYKNTYQKAFCSTICKDQFWNVVSSQRLRRLLGQWKK